MESKIGLATRRWLLGTLVLLFGVGLAGCAPAAPEVTPAGPEVAVASGDTIAIQANARGADTYKWTLTGIGEISATEGPSVLYAAPMDAGGKGLLTVTAHNDRGASPATTLVIKVSLPPPSITIASPLAEAVCPLNEECRFDVRGASVGLASASNLQVIVWVRDGLWFPHKWVTIQSDGAWQRRTQIGYEPCWEAGYRFEIVAMVMDWEEADAIPTEFQSLPTEYVALSNYVALETTYDSVSIDLSRATPSTHLDSESTVEMSKSPISLTMDYNLGTSGWAQATVPLNLDMSCVKELGFSIVFSLEGTGAANTIEVNLEDSGSTKYGWSREGGSVTNGVEQIEVLLSSFKYVGDPRASDKDLDWSEVTNIFFATSQQLGDDGGSGRVEISDVRLVPPTVP